MINYEQVRRYHLENRKRPSPSRSSQILVIGFAAIILVGTVLLMLPVASAGPEPVSWDVALFTSTSATTVTGLVVVNTHDTYSVFGEVVILILMQVGGVGFIVLSIVLFRLIGRRVSLYERNLLRQNLGVEEEQGIVQLARHVLRYTLIIEFIGAVILFSQWVQTMAWPTAAYFAIFHSVSAFCNAGFDLFQSFEDPALIAARNNPISILTFSALIFVGSLGIAVVYDLILFRRERHLSLHTRLVLPFSLILVVLGTVLILIDEAFVDGHALSEFPVAERIWLAYFISVASRTAGTTLVPMADLGQASQLVVLLWMFVGGAPASMAGGVGLSTVAVVLITLGSNVRGYDDVRILNRTIPVETIFKAVAVITVSSLLVVGLTLVLTLLSQGDTFVIAFEVISAFANTGFTLNFTDKLNLAGRLIIVFTMFWGRLGPLTLVVALAQRHRPTLVRYPEEKIIIG
ncbi:MAG TPA: potassium transporter TrkG [Anaerolineae bacterium]|nr:potassium transporter TrkG [Anaerolineae bacterium]HMR65423.1 potassium transporter TrkG [Anaerolineae bacterium]